MKTKFLKLKPGESASISFIDDTPMLHIPFFNRPGDYSSSHEPGTLPGCPLCDEYLKQKGGRDNGTET